MIEITVLAIIMIVFTVFMLWSLRESLRMNDRIFDGRLRLWEAEKKLIKEYINLA